MKTLTLKIAKTKRKKPTISNICPPNVKNRLDKFKLHICCAKTWKKCVKNKTLVLVLQCNS